MWVRVKRWFLTHLRVVHLHHGAPRSPWRPPSCRPLGWRERNGQALGGRPCVRPAAALPSETAQFNQCHGTGGEGALSWLHQVTGGSLRGGRGRPLGPGQTRSGWVEAAGAAHRAQVWDSAEVRGRRSGAPRCGSLWGDLGTAWGSGKPLWAGRSWSAVLQEG